MWLDTDWATNKMRLSLDLEKTFLISNYDPSMVSLVFPD